MQHSPSKNNKQSGITLVVALIMLTVLTAMAMTVANMSTVDLKIAGNQQAAQQARAAAESGIDALLNDTPVLQTYAPFSYVTSATETLPAQPHVVNGPAGSGWSASVTVKRMGDPLPCPTASLPVNNNNIDSTKIAKCVYFEVTSIGTAARNSTSTITRGFYRKVGGFTG